MLRWVVCNGLPLKILGISAEAVDDFHDVAKDVALAGTMEGLRSILGESPNLAYLSYMANRLRECHRVLKKTGTIYLHCDPTMSNYLKVVMDGVFGMQCFRNEIVWHYRRWTAGTKDFQRMHDIILRYSKSDNFVFNLQYDPYGDWIKKDYKYVDDDTGKRWRWHTVKGKRYKVFLEDIDRGVKLNDVWMVPYLGSIATERLSYPTQKPLKLLERIVKASSNEGDVILDPFCGCGTTIHAAQNLSRQWIWIDVCVKACQVIKKRIEDHFDSMWSKVELHGFPKTLDDARELAEMNKFKFEKWVASLVDGMEGNKKQRGDGGIDGRGRIAVGKGKFIDFVSQVKGGNTGPGDVQAFNGARQQAKDDFGISTYFQDRVTDGMKNTSVSAGRFMEVPRIKIYTIEDFFEGRKPEFPNARNNVN